MQNVGGTKQGTANCLDTFIDFQTPAQNQRIKIFDIVPKYLCSLKAPSTDPDPHPHPDFMLLSRTNVLHVTDGLDGDAI